MRFTRESLRRAEQRRRARQQGEGRHNLRATLESTVRSVKYPFRAGKAPVRGRFRVACMVIGSVAVVNVRLLHRFLQARMRPKPGEKGQEAGQTRQASDMEQLTGSPLFTFVKVIRALLWRFLTTQPHLRPVISR